MTNDIKLLIKARDKACTEHRITQDDDSTMQNSKTLRNKVTSILKQPRTEFEQRRIDNAGNDSRKLWKILNSYLAKNKLNS